MPHPKANATLTDAKGKSYRVLITPSFDGYTNVWFCEDGKTWRDNLNDSWKVVYDAPHSHP